MDSHTHTQAQDSDEMSRPKGPYSRYIHAGPSASVWSNYVLCGWQSSGSFFLLMENAPQDPRKSRNVARTIYKV